MTTELQNGFVLTRTCRDVNGHVEIEYWLATDQGPARLLIPKQPTVFFIQTQALPALLANTSPNTVNFEYAKLNLKTFSGQAVTAIYCKTNQHGFALKDLVSKLNIVTYEADIRPHDRYLMERFAYGSIAFQGEHKRRGGFDEYRRAQLKATDYAPKLTALSIDIECAMDEKLFSVGIAGRYLAEPIQEVIMIGEPQAADTPVIWVPDERQLLVTFIQLINELDPDLLIGWNVINFDLRILIQRAQSYDLTMRLGRGNSIATWRARRGDEQKGFVSIPGRVAIDGIDALKSATWSFASFSLEQVAQELLGRGKKVEQDVDDRVAEIVHNFNHNKAALAAYNLEDCELVLDIFEHTRIIDYLVLRSQMTGLELDRAGGSVAAFTNLYLPKLHRGGYVAPNLPDDGGLASPGGYVMDSIPGLYKNVLVLDFKSLYPSIIRTFKIDPMGLIEGLKNPEQSIPGFRDAYFDRDRHYLPSIIEELWQQRDQAKRDNDAVRSQAIKIIMNSFYGVLGSGGCRFYDTRLASSITLRGHEIMQTTSEWIKTEGYTVIYGDTDSTFVALDEALPAQDCQAIGNELAKLINHKWQHLLERDYQLECHLEIEFETHFSRFLMPKIRGSETGSKKRYAGLVQDAATAERHLVFKGLENVRTDWTQLARDFQTALFEHVFNDLDPSQLIMTTVAETLSGARDAHLVYRKQLRRPLSQYVKNVPPQVRAARLADERNAELEKTLRYQNKGWVSYVMTLNGPEPLEYRHSAIDYQHYVDKQLKPIADGVLPFIGLSFDALISQQGELF